MAFPSFCAWYPRWTQSTVGSSSSGGVYSVGEGVVVIVIVITVGGIRIRIKVGDVGIRIESIIGGVVSPWELRSRIPGTYLRGMYQYRLIKDESESYTGGTSDQPCKRINPVSMEYFREYFREYFIAKRRQSGISLDDVLCSPRWGSPFTTVSCSERGNSFRLAEPIDEAFHRHSGTTPHYFRMQHC